MNKSSDFEPPRAMSDTLTGGQPVSERALLLPHLVFVYGGKYTDFITCPDTHTHTHKLSLSLTTGQRRVHLLSTRQTHTHPPSSSSPTTLLVTKVFLLGLSPVPILGWA